jgi:hypothetical protein
MDSLETWVAFRRGEQVNYDRPRCHWCGKECSGDATTPVNGRDVPVCETGPCAEEGLACSCCRRGVSLEEGYAKYATEGVVYIYCLECDVQQEIE